MASDLNTILKKYLANLGKNEELVVELTRNIRSWVVQNGENVKERIEAQIDETAVRMGFAKNTEIENLNARIAELESRLKSVAGEDKKPASKVKKVSGNNSSTSKKVTATSKARVTKKVIKKRVSK